ncbi:Mu-like prophage major head subunit gpT family protein [Photobacterium sp. WH24]|uniref:Mu-like prophage major head subunit gpT family protein n=1 Tax=Photobacterium sp. WH24 TaxID=2827237 RepID=UPI001C43ADB4|nr:Mu-like prophage major head subunit gpT family protein [Photobacterium sp. WH24]MBV7262568.1 Mu-like prophage major head subunit gpT family protein [Photobacterium sp. WH24]
MPVSAEQLRNMTTGLSAAYQKGLGAATPQYTKIATVLPSSTSAEDYGFLGSWPEIKEWIGDRQLAALTQHGYTIVNKKFEASIKVEKDKVEDDQIGQYGLMAETIGQDTALFPDKLTYSLLPLGFSTECYDGQYFFDTDHPMAAGVATNVIGDPATDTGEPWFLLDCSRPLKPVVFQNRRAFEFKALDDMNSDHVVLKDEFIYATDGRCNAGFGFWQMAIGSKAPLTEENINKARKLLRSFQKDNGTPLGSKATTLVVGGDNEAAAEKLILTAEINGTTNVLYKKFELIVSEFVA